MSGFVQLRRDKRSPQRDLGAFLPTCRAEMDARGWSELDVLIVTGDAYVDHPSFGAAIIGRALEQRGLRVGVVAQPRWDVPDELLVMGAPRLFVGVTAGNMDSMLNRLTAQKKLRSEDQYSPDGKIDSRPNRASIVYANLCRQAFPGVPIVLGGIEASLRRIVHYDYWEDHVRRSILLDSKADLLIFGMGERPVREVSERMRALVGSGLSPREAMKSLRDVRGTAFVLRKGEWESREPSRYVRDGQVVILPRFEELRDLSGPEAKRRFAEMSRAFQFETNPGNGRPLLQPHGHEAVYLNPPAFPLTEAEMDELYDAPYTRTPHWSYGGARIPAFETIKHSIVTMRGCFGGCAFCSITEHEGRAIQSRSEESILREVRAMQRAADAIGFKGVLSDLGGPTANMYKMTCRTDEIERACRKLSCVHPGICENLVTDHGPLLSLMKRVREEPGIKRVMIASGVRYDLADQGVRGGKFIEDLARHHTGGQLSVAPEHNEDRVLQKMKKPGIGAYERFAERFACASDAAGKEQYLVPYFISGHPGSTLADMISLAQYLKARGMRPRQVQDFIPTPMSMATSMHVTGIDPLTMTAVHTVTDLREKKLHKALLLYWDQEHHDLAREALRKAGRLDLIGTGPSALVPPPPRAAPVARAGAKAREGLRGRR
ncbi:MAG: YgiQ family radical SAM protein [Deltaproteobacteria bacterium]|nr:YgiQ family radical SAM protein [Deltaproteobacteria bacterium]